MTTKNKAATAPVKQDKQAESNHYAKANLSASTKSAGFYLQTSLKAYFLMLI